MKMCLAVVSVLVIGVSFGLWFWTDGSRNSEAVKSIPVDRTGQLAAYVDHPNSGNRIDFSESEVMVTDLGTKETWRLTKNDNQDTRPTWSPSRTSLLFLSSRPGASPYAGLYSYDLHTGSTKEIDLSWLTDHEEVGVAPDLVDGDGWIQCGVWVPTDTSSLYVGLLSREPGSRFDSQINLVRVDTKKRSIDILSKIEICGFLSSSPNGAYVVGPTREDGGVNPYVDVLDTRSNEWLRAGTPMFDAEGQTYAHYALNWLSESRLAMYAQHRGEGKTYIYSYDVGQGNVSVIDTTSVVSSETIRSLVRRNPGKKTNHSGRTKTASYSIILIKDLGEYGSEDLFLRDLDTGSEVRLTETKSPKTHISVQ